MKQLSSEIFNIFAQSDEEALIEYRKALRVSTVRSLWENLVEDIFLEHTNGVYILEEDDRKIMHVYVDEGIYAAELNNRREMIQLLCAQRYGEVIDEFNIHVSYGLMKQRYPFKEELHETVDKNPPIPLDAEELAQVDQTCATIENETIRAAFRKAMIADLEWKKGNLQ